VQQTSAPETTKPSHDSNNSHVPIHLKSEDYGAMVSELVSYKKRYEEAEEKRRIAESMCRQIQSLRQMPEDVTNVICQNTRTIHVLKMRLQDRREYLSFNNAPNAVSNSHRLTGLFRHLKDRIPTVLVIDGAEQYPIKNLLHKSDDLNDLLIIVFGDDTLCKLEGTPNAFPNSTSHELILALTGASIYSWVFEAEFQTHMMRTTPLLEEYRSLITTLCKLESINFPRDSAYVL
jgi:hypothetical protein